MGTRVTLIGRALSIALVLSLFLPSAMILSSPRAAASVDSDGDGLSDDVEIDLLGTDHNDWTSPGPHVIYDDSFKTLDYACWQTYSNGTESITLAAGDVVVRRGISFELHLPEGADVSIDDGGKETPPSISGDYPRSVDVGADATVGIYPITITMDGQSAELRLFVIFDPWASGIQDNYLRTYAYDESSHMDEQDVIWPTLSSPRISQLRPFDGADAGNPSVYELALTLIDGSSEDIDAVFKIYRLSSQRNEADLTSETSFVYQDIRDILFTDNDTVEPVTLSDAASVGQNGVSLNSLGQDPARTKTINGWCMEATMTVISLCRAVGIPARAVTMYSLEGLMGHYVPEVWLTDPPPLYDSSLNPIPDVNWYVFDADEWLYPVDFWAPAEPVLYAQSGNNIVPRHMYDPVFNQLMKDHYHMDQFYCIGPSWDTSNPINLRSVYKNDYEFRLPEGSHRYPMGHGLGYFFYVNNTEPGKQIRLETDDGIDAVLLVSRESNPGHDMFYTGYPITDDENTTKDNTFVMKETGIYYISVFPSHEYTDSSRGNYGYFTIHVEDSDGGPDPVILVSLLIIAALGIVYWLRRNKAD